jgi:hypothetical protein
MMCRALLGGPAISAFVLIFIIDIIIIVILYLVYMNYEVEKKRALLFMHVLMTVIYCYVSKNCY